IKDYEAGRARNAEYYSRRLSALPDVADSGEAPPAGARLVLPSAAKDRGHVWNQYTLRVPGEGRRDSLRIHLTQKGIGSEIYYPIPMHRQECFSKLPAHSLSGCVVSDQLASEVLSVPVYPELTQAQLDDVVAAVASFQG